MKKSRRKALGQHFLKDKKALRNIVSLINPSPEDTLIEIGPGKGALTFLLTPNAGKVFAIEKDPLLASSLKERAPKNLCVLKEDILKITLDEILPTPHSIKVVGNLPYSISTPILFKVLEEKSLISACYFLLQKEVAERLCALPGSKAYAPLSIFFLNSFFPKLHFSLPPNSFYPPPKVDSAFISLIKRPAPLFRLPNESEFLQFLKKAFRHRRKTLYNNLLLASFSPLAIKKALTASQIDIKIRPEQVHLEQFVCLYNHI